ncbi:uncharacterized protein LOC120720703 [Simochromis diagramma]|uniref:uncharacterized protein LOC120720703 n=1 Tax=Simochromis diagramma TaxID=43689 RepID=UPI001A7E872A|nr:uncharacterized protein LOC120720703 [Simochromis diagramma]XP_039866415.1 uncharacterized protein LOC120720703 [Simochromis diagramma]
MCSSMLNPEKCFWAGMERFAYCVPLLNILKGMLESSFWQGLISVNPNNVSRPDVLRDCCDGNVFVSNKFFQENPHCLKLVLYQDAFEVVNPLGSAKKKHKVLAVYFSLLNIPLTPFIIVCGSSCFAAETLMLSIDKKTVNDRITTFTSAICLMFGSYYCFNIHYPVELRSTLEFLQRCFFSINPERGTKVESKKKKVFSVNPRVLTLISDIADHEWL